MSTLALGVAGNCSIAGVIDCNGRHARHVLGRRDGGHARFFSDEALTLFNNLLARRGHVGLLSEDIDPLTGEPWGNFPQTCSHVGVILSAMRLSRSWEEGLWHAS